MIFIAWYFYLLYNIGVSEAYDTTYIFFENT